MRYELTDHEWAAIKPMLPNKVRGVPRVNDRRVLNAIFWVLRSGAPWRDLPNSFGPYTTCYNRFVRWRRAGVWSRIMETLAAAHDAAVQMIDHLLSNIVLKLAILNAAGIADDMKGHVLGNVFGDIRKIFAEVVVIRSQIQWSRQRLKAGVAIADRLQWADTGMGLRVLSLGTRAHVTGVQGRFRSLDFPGRMFHGASSCFAVKLRWQAFLGETDAT